MIVIWNWNAHKVFNNSEWSFFFSPSNDIIYEQKGLPSFTWRSIKLPKRGNAKKQHTDRDTHTHTICDSFLLLFGFRSRPFWRADYYLLSVCVCVPVNLFSAFWLLFGFLFANFHAYAVVLYWKSNFRVLFFMLTKCSIYRQDFSKHSTTVPLWFGKRNESKQIGILDGPAPPIDILQCGPCVCTRIKYTRIKSRQIRWQEKNPLRTCTKYTKPCDVTLE